MIGIQLASKNNKISANAFVRSLNSFMDLLKDVDSVLSQKSRGSIRWELSSLQMNSPALVEVVGVSKIREMDYSQAVQDSVLDGIEQLAQRPEQPQFYSFSALRKLQQMSEQSKQLNWLSIYSDSRRAVLNDRLSVNVEYLVATGSRSLGSVRGSLDAIVVHSGHEFRVWSPKWRKPIVCYFDQSILDSVTAHLKQQVEVIGEIFRNQTGEPVSMKVEQFVPLAPTETTPRIEDLCGIISGIYAPGSLQEYLEDMRNG